MAFRVVLVAAACLVVAGCHSRTSPGSGEQADPEAARELVGLEKRVGAFQQRLVAIRRAVPDAANVDDQPCPDAAIEKKLGGSSGSLLLADYDYLVRYAGGSADPYAGDHQRWKLLTTPELRVVPPRSAVHTTKQANDALWNIKKVQRDYDYIGVIRSSQRELPRLDGDRFHAGVFSGGLFVFDLASGKPLCRARVDAHSSEQAAGVKGQSAADVLWNDFSMKLRQDLDAALSRITKQLTLDLG